jgi:hypothetical protein
MLGMSTVLCDHHAARKFMGGWKMMMKTLSRVPSRRALLCTATVALALSAVFSAPTGVWAAEADAKRLLKAMSDYVGAQKTISFDFDASLEVVTNDEQKLSLASSGTVALSRPGSIRATRAGGHADTEMLYDGKTLTLLGKGTNLYTQIALAGTLDHLVDELREKYKRPLPAADLILPNSYDPLMEDVTDIKDLGSGVINGVECDYLAFRKKALDFQIWIAQGDQPYPCRYTVTSKDIPHSPQYTIQVRNWKAGDAVITEDFSFNNATKAKKVDIEDLKGMSVFPDHFKGESQ